MHSYAEIAQESFGGSTALLAEALLDRRHLPPRGQERPLPGRPQHALGLVEKKITRVDEMFVRSRVGLVEVSGDVVADGNGLEPAAQVLADLLVNAIQGVRIAHVGQPGDRRTGRRRHAENVL